MIHRAAQLYGAFTIRQVAVIAVFALCVSALLAFSRPIVMLVDGERVDSDVSPIATASERAFVPLRSIADALGAETEVDPKSGAIDVVLGGQTLRVRVGDPHASLDGMPFTLKHPPFRVRGHVMISLDVVARALRVHAKYDPRTARIEVMTPGIGQVPAATQTAVQ